MRRRILAAICPDSLRPMDQAEVYRRAARRSAIAAEQQRIAKASEADLPVEQRRQVIDVRELGHATAEMALACLIAAPAACTYVLWLALA